MVFLVKSDLASAVRGVGGSRSAQNGSSSPMNHFDVGRKQYLPPARPDRSAEIHVLDVHEIAFIEQPDRFGIAARNQQARTADPVGPLLAAGHLFDLFRDRSVIPGV